MTNNINIRPDIKLSVKQTFGFESDMEIDAFSKKSEFVPDVDKDYKFDRVEVVSAGERDPDAEGTTGMSASKMREYVMSNNFDEFKKGVMTGTGDRNAMTLFKDLKKKMGVSELNMPSLEDEISNEKQKIRENYFDNKTLLIGDLIENTNNGNVGKIIKRGANYIQYEMEDGGIEKAWLHDVMPADNIQSELRN